MAKLLTPEELQGKALSVAGQSAPDGTYVVLNGAITSYKPAPERSDSSTMTALAKEWDRSFKANEHVAMKRDNPRKWETLFVAKYGKKPNT